MFPAVVSGDRVAWVVCIIVLAISGGLEYYNFEPFHGRQNGFNAGYVITGTLLGAFIPLIFVVGGAWLGRRWSFHPWPLFVIGIFLTIITNM